MRKGRGKQRGKKGKKYLRDEDDDDDMQDWHGTWDKLEFPRREAFKLPPDNTLLAQNFVTVNAEAQWSPSLIASFVPKVLERLKSAYKASPVFSFLFFFLSFPSSSSSIVSSYKIFAGTTLTVEETYSCYRYADQVQGL